MKILIKEGQNQNKNASNENSEKPQQIDTKSEQF